MSTHDPPETGYASPLASDPPSTDERDSTEKPSFDAHDAAATFDPHSTVRLPNTVDEGNARVG